MNKRERDRLHRRLDKAISKIEYADKLERQWAKHDSLTSKGCAACDDNGWGCDEYERLEFAYFKAADAAALEVRELHSRLEYTG